MLKFPIEQCFIVVSFFSARRHSPSRRYDCGGLFNIRLSEEKPQSHGTVRASEKKARYGGHQLFRSPSLRPHRRLRKYYYFDLVSFTLRLQRIMSDPR